MPTASKLVSALCLAALGYLVADLIKAHLPEEVPGRYLHPVLIIFGVLVGWRFLGRRLGGGMRHAFGLGLSSVVAMGLCSMLWFSGHEMIIRAMRKSYGADPFAALMDMVNIALDLAPHLAYPDVIAAIVIGGLIAGVVGENAAQRWT